MFQGNEILDLSDSEMNEIRGSGIGMIFQQPQMALNPVMRVSDHFIEVLKLHAGLSNKEARLSGIELLEKVGIPGAKRIMRAYPHELSGGEQQRVAIARALVHNPAFVLADEPTGNLDSKNSNAIMDLLTTLNKDGATVILITHDLEVAALTKRQIVLEDGRINSDSNFVSRE